MKRANTVKTPDKSGNYNPPSPPCQGGMKTAVRTRNELRYYERKSVPTSNYQGDFVRLRLGFGLSSRRLVCSMIAINNPIPIP